MNIVARSMRKCSGLKVRSRQLQGETTCDIKFFASPDPVQGSVLLLLIFPRLKTYAYSKPSRNRAGYWGGGGGGWCQFPLLHVCFFKRGGKRGGVNVGRKITSTVPYPTFAVTIAEVRIFTG
jgi:hypothetical protein